MTPLAGCVFIALIVAGVIQFVTWFLDALLWILPRWYAWRAPPAPPPPLVVAPPPPPVQVQVRTFIDCWNGCRFSVDTSREWGRVALLGALLLEFPWHRRPMC